jgi:hypothetical protein
MIGSMAKSKNKEREVKSNLATRRDIVRWTGVVLFAAGAVIALTPLFLGYAPLSNPAWWSTNFNLFWGGIAVFVVGVGTLLAGQYAMEVAVPPYKERRKMEIPA